LSAGPAGVYAPHVRGDGTDVASQGACAVSTHPTAAPRLDLPRVLCIVVVVVMLAASIYAAWIAIRNFPDIGV
jgi:hypothetical protein